jgi:class 3 adenylate cyclase
MEIDLAIVFVDVCDSTRLYEAIGNVDATAVIQDTLAELRRLVMAGGGRVIKSLGDGLMCVFTSPDAACATAHALVSRTEQGGRGRPIHRGAEVRIRIGVHFGNVVERDQDLFGDAINVTARVQSLASPGEILVTDEVLSRAGSAARVGARLIDTTAVRGKTVPVRIYTLSRGNSTSDTMDRTALCSPDFQRIREGLLRLHLWYQGKATVVARERPKLTIGRHEASDIILLSRQASRQHGSIEFLREAFMVTDHSSNGTFIHADGGPPILLRRDSAKLVGRGLLGFGALAEDPDQLHVVRYSSDFED